MRVVSSSNCTTFYVEVRERMNVCMLGVRVAGGECTGIRRWQAKTEYGYQDPQGQATALCKSRKSVKNSLLETPHDDKQFVFWVHVRQISMSCVEKVVSRFTYVFN